MEAIITGPKFSIPNIGNKDVPPDSWSSINKNNIVRQQGSCNRREQLSNKALSGLFLNISKTVRLQVEEWRERPFYQRQYIYESFKKVIGMSIDQFLMNFENLSSLTEMSLEDTLRPGENEQQNDQDSHLLNLYEKDKIKTLPHSEPIKGWF